MSEITETSAKRPPPGEAPRDSLRAISVVRQWLVTSGDESGTRARRTFLYSLAIAARDRGSRQCDQRDDHLARRSQGRSAGTGGLGGFELDHVHGVLLDALARLAVCPIAGSPTLEASGSYSRRNGFFARPCRRLRAAPQAASIGWLGAHYDYGNFVTQYFYEFGKDALGYAGLFVAGFTLVDHLLRQQALIAEPARARTFDIRDGAKLTRVRLDDIFAIASAGNYVEFVLRDGRRMLMRSPLSALELELAARGFVRTHRSWLVNAEQVTALKPEGSGDYAVELPTLTVPLSRRFPEALAKLRRE